MAMSSAKSGGTSKAQKKTECRLVGEQHGLTKRSMPFSGYRGGDQIQRQLDGSTRNSHVFANVAEKMRDAGYERTASQCHIKIKAVKREYRVIKDHNSRSGNAKKTSRYGIVHR